MTKQRTLRSIVSHAVVVGAMAIYSMGGLTGCDTLNVKDNSDLDKQDPVPQLCEGECKLPYGAAKLTEESRPALNFKNIEVTLPAGEGQVKQDFTQQEQELLIPSEEYDRDHMVANPAFESSYRLLKGDGQGGLALNRDLFLRCVPQTVDGSPATVIQFQSGDVIANPATLDAEFGSGSLTGKILGVNAGVEELPYAEQLGCETRGFRTDRYDSPVSGIHVSYAGSSVFVPLTEDILQETNGVVKFTIPFPASFPAENVGQVPVYRIEDLSDTAIPVTDCSVEDGSCIQPTCEIPAGTVRLVPDEQSVAVDYQNIEITVSQSGQVVSGGNFSSSVLPNEYAGAKVNDDFVALYEVTANVAGSEIVSRSLMLRAVPVDQNGSRGTVLSGASHLTYVQPSSIPGNEAVGLQLLLTGFGPDRYVSAPNTRAGHFDVNVSLGGASTNLTFPGDSDVAQGYIAFTGGGNDVLRVGYEPIEGRYEQATSCQIVRGE